MGGSTKQIAGKALLTGLSLAAIPFTGGASLEWTLGAGAAGALAGGLAGKAESDAIKANQRIQEETNKLTIAQQKRDAGAKQIITNPVDIVSKGFKSPSALVKSMLTRNQQQKLGD